MTIGGQTKGKQRATNKNDKNIKNEKKIINNKKEKKGFVPPSLEDVKKYVLEKNLKVSAEFFYNYFTEGKWKDSNGKEVRSWKQKILTWNSFDKKSTSKKEEQPKKQYQNYQQRNYENLDEIIDKIGG